jgi:O-antigen ligase
MTIQKLLKWLISGAIILAPIFFIPIADPFGLPKLLVLTIFSFSILGFFLFSEYKLFNFRVVNTWVIIFIILSLVTFLTSGSPYVQQLYGVFTRQTGLIAYLSLLIMLTASVYVSSIKNLVFFGKIFIIPVIITLVVGFLQIFRIGPKYLLSPDGQVMGLMGNTNFHAAFLGIAGSSLIPFLISSATNKKNKLFLIVLLFLIIYQINKTTTRQGFYLIFGAFYIVLLIYTRRQKVVRLGLTLLGFVFGISILFGIFNRGWLSGIVFERSIQDRGYCMAAAIEMLKSRPFNGVGFDAYINWWGRSRSADSIIFKGIDGYCDVAHNVLLDFAATGGSFYLLIYIFLLILVIDSIRRLLKQNKDFDPLLTSLICFWITYQVQSLISINQLGLATLGWISSGLILGLRYNLFDIKNSRFIQKNTKVRRVQWLGVVLGFLIGFIITVLPIINQKNILDSVRGGDAKLLDISANKFPVDAFLLNYVIAIQIEAKDYDRASVNLKRLTKVFPDNYLGWENYYKLNLLRSEEVLDINKELLRLFPLRKN